MGTSKRGKASLLFEDPPLILSAASVVGKKEGEGPLGKYFDRIEMDSMLGKRTWEEAESELQTRTARLAIEKSGLDKEEIRYYFGGDLLAQLIATSFGSMDLEFPLFGLYGACSTMGEGLQLGSMTVAGDFADRVLVTASSHFASAEKQFRFPWSMGTRGRFLPHGPSPAAGPWSWEKAEEGARWPGWPGSPQERSWTWILRIP